MIECWKMLVALVAVWGWLLLLPTPSYAQNHTCHKIETVKVRVAVPLQVPATFRSYTWCLKVPPRCSKYTVFMRERIIYQTEVRNHTVTECCAGYVSLYGVCVPACTTCAYMRCDTARNCTCTPGYLGPHCNQTCEFGKWGERCREACVCRVGEDCDPGSGACTPSTSTTASPATVSATPPSTSTTTTTSTARTPQVTKNPPTTANSFVDLTLTEPTTSSEDLTDFNILLRPRTNDSVRLVNNDVNTLNALGDLDYPILPTDSAVESFNYIQSDQDPSKHIGVNSASVNNSVVNARWISELGAHSGVTFGSALALIALLIVTVSAVVRCRNSKVAQHQVSPVENSLVMVPRKNKSHYAVPGPPSFSFINGYSLDLASDVIDDTYDHPRSIRCSLNEPVYDELRY